MIQPLGAATARAEFERPSTLNAPLFQSLIERLDQERRWVVLDLGAAHAATIGVFGRLRCRLEIAAIADSLDTLAKVEAEELVQAAQRLLPAPSADLADIVLCWDLLNYLEQPSLSALMEAIALRGRPGTVVHALMGYAEPQMPALPGTYVVREDLRIQRLDRQPDARAAPRYTPDELGRHMPQCRIERGVLLANGMQEFLFVL